MITQVQQDMEDGIYKTLEEGDVGKKVIAKYYPRQSVKELVDVMMKGYKMSWVSDVVKHLESRDEVPNFEAICDAAFKGALLRLLKEAEDVRVQETI